MSSYTVLKYPGAELPANYVAVVYSRWLRSLRYGNDHYRLIDQETYFARQHAHIDCVLRRPSTVVVVAALSDEPDTLLGWAIYSGDTLHYVHVQRDFRRKGIARALVPPSCSEVTHLTFTGMSIWANKAAHLKFNPWG